MLGLIGGSLAAGSGLLVLMTYLETSLHRSLAPDDTQRAPTTEPADLDERDEPTRLAA